MMVKYDMGYSSTWEVLESMIADFRKRGVNVSSEVMTNLKSAKTLIKILNADRSNMDTLQKIEEYIGNVESYLVSEGEKNFGEEYVNEWLKRLEEANRKTDEEEAPRFVIGLPQKGKWVRIKPSGELTLEKLKKSAMELNLSYSLQDDGYLLVHGADKCVKEFVRKLAKGYGLKTKE
jgi:hypothetical protein